MKGSHTVVVGAGVVGVCTAYFLARRGHRVTLLDQGDVNSGASFGNAGIIALGHPPIPRPGLIRQTFKWIFDSASPLYIPPRLDPRLLSWLWQLRRACTHDHEEHCMTILTALGRASIEWFDRLVAEEDLQCEYRRSGWMEVFRTPKGFEAGLRDADLVRRHGVEVEVLEAEQLAQREPALLPGMAGAVRYPQSGVADPNRFVVELADRARRRGAEIRPNTKATELIERGGALTAVATAAGERIDADTVVLAAGAWTTRLARRAGVHVPMQAGKGYHLDVSRPDPCPQNACVFGEVFVAATPMGGGLRLAGTMEFSGINDRLVRKRLDLLMTGARQYLAGIDAVTPQSQWCGLRPCTPDGLPVVGWAPNVAGVFIATGHARMGFTLGPITGKLASECILDGEPSIDISPLRVQRFRQPRARRGGGRGQLRKRSVVGSLLATRRPY